MPVLSSIKLLFSYPFICYKLYPVICVSLAVISLLIRLLISLRVLVLKVSNLRWTPGGVLDKLINVKREIQDRKELTCVNQS